MSVPQLGTTVYVCEECDALWRRAADVAPSGFDDFQTFLRARGLELRVRRGVGRGTGEADIIEAKR
jgi:hypothetical protein